MRPSDMITARLGGLLGVLFVVFGATLTQAQTISDYKLAAALQGLKVRGMDSDDGPCHAASFGIPAYVIAYLEPPIHLSDSLLLPETPHLEPLRPTSTFSGASTTAASVVSSRKVNVSWKYSSTAVLEWLR